jgi:hypothetical protein
MSGYNPLQDHYGGFVMANNSGAIILFYFFSNFGCTILSLNMVKPLPSLLTKSLKWFALVVKIYVYISLLGHATLVQTIV